MSAIPQPFPSHPNRAVSPERRRGHRSRWPLTLSLREKLLLACLLMTGITIALGAFGQSTQQRIGAVGVRIFDRTFMSMSYLRSAQNGLIKLRATIDRVEFHSRDRALKERVAEAAAALKSALPDILGDLDVSRERATSAEAKANTTSLHARLLTLGTMLDRLGTEALQADLAEIETAFDTAIENDAAVGFNERREVERLIADLDRKTFGAIALSVILAAAISFLLARSVLPPIRDALAIALSISSGKLDNAIRPRGGDEIASLLRALSTMQSSLSDKIGHINRLATEATTQAEQLSLQNGRFEGALDNMIQGLSMFDAQGRLVVHNHRFEEMFGVPGTDAAASSMTELPASASPGDTDGGTRTIEMPDGRMIAVSHRPMTDGGWVDTFEDVTERHRAEASLERMARYDGLTKLPNRSFFRERLEEALGKTRGQGGPVVLCLDLDGFKTVNDMLGHMVGDGLLKLVAQRLLDCVRPTDVVGRLGGDEFAIIQTDAADAAETEALAKRIVAAIAAVFEIEAFQVVISVSIGIAREETVPDAPLAERATALLKNADVALYRAKVEGRSTFRFFAAEMDRKLQARRLLEMDLRGALEREQFELFFQPLVDTNTGSVCCFEALLRWNHPERGTVSPVEFIPVAEETGLIKALGRWVLQRACLEAAGWPDEISVAVNLSPVQFHNPFLAAEIVGALDGSGLDPRRLELEITESVLIMEDALVLNTLHQIRGLGVRIALDDFGTGYSSLSYLRRFPFDKIKIDRSFVSELSQDNLAIVQAIMGLGRALKMDVVAEGVETIEQQDVLVEHGCTELQGYYFSRPEPARQIGGLIDRLRTALPRCA